MTTYKTGNPIGSTDARDLYDNAQNLDNFANGTAASYTDRLGVSRRSLSGIDSAADNVLNSIGYAVPVAYASGISLTLTSQTVDYNGVIYAPLSSALPFTTSSWGTDAAKFRAIQVTDADLITYTPAGTGAVATTVQSKLQERVSITDFYANGSYGAKVDPTGNIDSTLGIQAAHNASFHVYYPEGSYLVSGKIAVRTGSNIEGASAGKTVVYLSGAMSGAEDAVYDVIVPSTDFVTQQGGIIVKNLFVNGNGHFGHGFKLRNIRFPIFDNVWVMNFNGSGLLLDYVEEGYFNFLNVNGCGRTAGNANLSTDTLYGQITFDRTADVYAASNNNFLRFNDCTVANGNCSGEWFVKAGSPSRIYINSCQSEISGVIRFNRDWLHGNGQGGIFFLAGCDVDGYRNVLNSCQYQEIYVTTARWGLNSKAYSSANGTGLLYINGSSVSDILNTSATSTMRISDTNFGNVLLNYPSGVIEISDGYGVSFSSSNIGANPVGAVRNVKLSGNLTTDSNAVNLPFVFDGVDVGGTLTINTFGTTFINGSVANYGNVNPDSRYEPRVFRVGSINYGPSAPSSGYYKAGSIVYNTAPTAGGAIGWVCVAEGFPGTWRTFGEISA